ncbi:hypothetical protein PCANB_001699 [Pneumocystis canis]|nr:hypothetical protein PCANB_001699 [Pneumocystis canis]
MLSRSELNTSPSPIWDSADPQRRPPPLPMPEELSLNHVDSSGKLSRASSISSHLHRQVNTKSPQLFRLGTDEKVIDMIYKISETTKTVMEDLHSLVDRSKDNASTLSDLKKNINEITQDQKMINGIRELFATQLREIIDENKYHLFQEKLDEILKILDTILSTYVKQTQEPWTDISEKLKAIEACQEKILAQKIEINHLISSHETSQQANFKEIEDIYRRKIELSTELVQLDACIYHKKNSLSQLEERMKTLENRLMEIQLKLNKQKDENKKLTKQAIKKKTYPPKPSTPQNIRHFSLSDIHNRNPSAVTLTPSTCIDIASNNTDNLTICNKEKRKTSWSRKVANVMGFPFQHNNKENSAIFLQNNEKSIIQEKQKNYPINFGIKSTKTFRSFSTRV